MAALFDMQMAGGDRVWKLGNGMKRCDSQSWFAPLVEWLMRRLFTHAANLFFFFSPPHVCVRLHFCMRSRAPALHPVSVRIQYVCHRAHTLRFYMCDCLCACIHHLPLPPSPRPQPRFLTFQLRLAGALTLLICSPPCLPRYPISPSISLRVSRS